MRHDGSLLAAARVTKGRDLELCDARGEVEWIGCTRGPQKSFSLPLSGRMKNAHWLRATNGSNLGVQYVRLVA